MSLESKLLAEEPTVVFVLEAWCSSTKSFQMWGTFSSEEKLRAKAVEIHKNVGPGFSQFHCNECEIDTGAISSVGFYVRDGKIVENPKLSLEAELVQRIDEVVSQKLIGSLLGDLLKVDDATLERVVIDLKHAAYRCITPARQYHKLATIFDELRSLVVAVQEARSC